MFGFNIDTLLSFIIAIIVSGYVSSASNPHEKDSQEYHSLRLCRIGLVFLVWSWGFGLIGFALALVAFILGIIGIVKGRTAYGVWLVLGSICLPVASMYFTMHSVLHG